MGKSPATDKAQHDLGTKDLDNAAARLASSMDSRAIKLRRVAPDRRQTRVQDIIISLLVCLITIVFGLTTVFYKHLVHNEEESIKLEQRLTLIEQHERENHPGETLFKPQPSQSSVK
jgi:hypothetical protein